MKAKDRIIVALDVDSPEKAISLVWALAPYVGCFKIGLQLTYVMLKQMIFPSNEKEAIENLKTIRQLFGSIGPQLFWDTKLDDIPNTVIGASRALAEMRVRMFNIHASCSIAAMMGAKENSGNALVLAVTVLTSLSEENAYLIFVAPSKAKVIQFARDAKLAGVDGIVCSPQELKILSQQKELSGLIKVTPDIQPNWSVAGDQKRITTPAQAIKDGADCLVIGRPITNPPEKIGSPVEAVKLIIEEITLALKEVRR